MDAKPQRPIRTVRIHGDENMPPVGTMSKTIHHRNKSSPALSTVAQGGGLKPTTKRSAFGDVSNTANTNRPIRDDSIIPTKGGFQGSEKIVSLQQEKKTTALLQPAQRPQSVAGLKVLLNNATNAALAVTVKPIQTEVQPAPQPANIRKILTKRSTTIFKDAALSQPDRYLPDLYKPLPAKAPAAPIHRDLDDRQSEVKQEVVEGPQQKLRRTRSVSAAQSQPKGEIELKPKASAERADNGIHRSDGLYVDDNGNQQVLQYTDETNVVDMPAHLSSKENCVSISKTLHIDGPLVQTKEESTEKARNGLARKQNLPPVSEPEEYWDEEEEEGFDEEGYVTARSVKSKGDNTTGGATTILFPKLNVKAKKEIAAAKELIESTRTADEIEDEAWDTTMVAEYGDEIFQYMKELEIKMLPNANYMSNQTEIQWSMRSVLMDWLVQVHHRFGLLPETLFLCVNYIDRFLSCKIVSLGKLQLVGATAIFVAAKYEEINCPSVQEIVYMVDGGYTVDEILKAERFMLSMLQFELGWPGPMSFLRRISKADDYDIETRTLAKYFLEITIMDERFVGSPPSFTAAGAHCLARMMLKKGSWSPAHVYYSNYTYSQLYPIVVLMLECCEVPHKHHGAIFEKYADKRYKRASHFVETEMARGFQLLDIASNNAANFYTTYDNSQTWNQK